MHKHIVLVECNRSICEQAVGEDMVPAQGRYVVAPACGKVRTGIGLVVGILVGQADIVAAAVPAQDEAVLVAQAPGDLAVKVVEIVIDVLEFAVDGSQVQADQRIVHQCMQAPDT